MGREARTRAANSGQPTNVVNQQVPMTGLAGERGRIIIHNEFVPGDRRNDIPVGGGPGRYRVVLTLTRPGYTPVAEREFSFAPAIGGDSHLAIASPAIKLNARPNDDIVAMYIDAEAPEGRIRFACRPNERGFLGRVETDLDASNLADAEHRAYRMLAPSLSSWSAQLDIPLHVWRVHVTALETGATQISIVNPYFETTLLAGNGAMSPEYRAFTSLYREALESQSPVYQFLCMFKMAEGTLVRRARLAKQAKARGEVFTRPVECVPENPDEFVPWLSALFPTRREWDEMAIDSIFVAEARGRRFGDLLKHELKDLRDAVAHALSDTTGTMLVSADEAMQMESVSRWIPLTKCIVRRLLKNEFPDEYLPYLREDGTMVDVAQATEQHHSSDVGH